MSLHVRTISPLQTVDYEHVHHITLSAVQGDMTVLPEHEPMIAQVKTGLVRIYHTRGHEYLFTQDGMVRIQHNEVTLTSPEIVPTESLNKQDLEEFIKQSTHRLEAAQSDSERNTVHADLQILKAKLEMMKNLKKYTSV